MRPLRPTLDRLRTDPWPTLIVAIYLALAVTYSVVNPLHEATDELRHFRYVRYIADFGRLPVQDGGPGSAQAHHPPLYYATAALASAWVRLDDPLYEPAQNPHWSYRYWEVGADNKNQYIHPPDEGWPYRGVSLAAHLARWITVLWGAGAVWITYRLGRLTFPDRPEVGLAAMAFVAFNPMFLYLAGAVNNDVPAALAGSALSLACLVVLRDGLTTRRAVALGVLYGLALLVKFNLAAMLAVIELALILAAWRARGATSRPAWAFVRANLIVGGLAALIAGWWFYRNSVLYGEPTGFVRVTQLWGVRDPRRSLPLALAEMPHAWSSLWARFGYGQIPLPTPYYTAMAVVCGAGLVGLIAYLVAHRRDLSQQGCGLAVLGATVVVMWAVLFGYTALQPAGAMGRFFFPALPALAVLVAGGLTLWLPDRLGRAAAGALNAAGLTLALISLIGYLAPAYAHPATLAGLPPDATRLAGQFDDVARVLGARVEPTEVRPGDTLNVSVYWEPLRRTDVPYFVFVHVIDQDGVIAAQRDTYPGLGNYLTTFWDAGRPFAETYRIVIPETAYTPAHARVQIGLYNPERGRLPLVGGGDALTLGSVEVPTDPHARYPNQQFQNFEDYIALVGYQIAPRAVHPGEWVDITLYWQSLAPTKGNYKVFVHLMSGWTKLAGADGWIETDLPYTSYWEPGQVYVDERSLLVPENLPPGTYPLHIGWYHEKSEVRLNLVAEDGHWIDDWLLLSNLRVLVPGEEAALPSS
jgi:hypothetical protein